MNKKQIDKTRIIALSSLLATLLAGCGGGSSSGTVPAAQAPVTASLVRATTPTKWASVKFGGGGYVPGLIYHPTSPDVLYARTDIGGAYRWDAASASWVAITDMFGPDDGFYHNSETMALDPNDDKRVYMGTGLYVGGSPNARLYISNDRGNTWTHVNLPFSAGGNNNGRAVGERLMVDPNLPSILYYATRASGLYKSADYGQTWNQVSALSSYTMSGDDISAAHGPIGFEQVIFDTSTKGTGSATQTIYTAVAKDYASVAGLSYSMYKTTDGGATWSGVATPADTAGAFIPHMVRNKDGMMYVAFTMGSGPGAGGAARLYKFDGTSWTLLKSYDPGQWSSFGMGGLSVSGTGPTTRIALGITNSWGNWDGMPAVQLSDDAGATWREIASKAPSGWIDDVEIDPKNPDHILHVHGGGVTETFNASAFTPTWTDASAGIEEVATKALMAPPPGASYSLLRAALDVGTAVQTELTKAPTRGSWGMFNSTFSIDMAWSAPSYIATVGSHLWSSDKTGAYSTDSGVTWQYFATQHPDAVGEGDASTVAVVKPGQVVWAPSQAKPAYTTDNGVTWTYTNLPAIANPGVDRAYKVVADRKNPNKVYAYESGGTWWRQWSETAHFYTSIDGGKTFTDSAAFPALTWNVNCWTSAIAVNPNKEGDIWIADGKNILHSSDSGVTWTRLDVTQTDWTGSNGFEPTVYGATSITLGKAPVGAAYSSSIYVTGVIGNVWGVHRSDDGGATWRRFNDDAHQFGGLSTLSADNTVPGRIYLSGAGRGVMFSY